MKYFKLLSVLIFLFVTVVSAKNVNAQVLPPEVTCTFDTYTVYPGTVSAVPYPFAASGGYLPNDIPFSVQLTCVLAGGGGSGGTYHVGLANDSSGAFSIEKTINGTGTGTYGTLSNSFGPHPAGATPVYEFIISAEVSGRSANVTCQPSSCQFRFGTIPFVLPPPPPTPSPTPPPLGSLTCPPPNGAFSDYYRYNPNPPVLNEPFQIQFNVPAGGIAGNFNIHWTTASGSTGQIGLLDVAGFGVWVANVPAQSSQFGWQLYGSPVGVGPDVSCGISGGVFSGVGIGGGSGLGSGKNPCEGGQCCTALGCFSTSLQGFSTNILTFAVGIAGGIAFILMVIGAIRILTSQGDPKGVAGGREMMVAAVAGLLFLIFSVIILRFIGVNLLGGVPGM